MKPIRIELPTGLGVGPVNAYLFTEPEVVLVDAGVNSDECWRGARRRAGGTWSDRGRHLARRHHPSACGPFRAGLPADGGERRHGLDLRAGRALAGCVGQHVGRATGVLPGAFPQPPRTGAGGDCGDWRRAGRLAGAGRSGAAGAGRDVQAGRAAADGRVRLAGAPHPRPRHQPDLLLPAGNGTTDFGRHAAGHRPDAGSGAAARRQHPTALPRCPTSWRRSTCWRRWNR